MPTKSTAKKEGAESVKKTPVTKAAPAKALVVEEVYVQFGGEEWKVADLSERAKAAYLAQGHRASGIKKLSVYVKPEEGKAYYVINDKESGSIDL